MRDGQRDREGDGGSWARPAGAFRANARRKVRLRARVTHIFAGWQRDVDVVDLGLGGACLFVDEFLSTGDPVSISFVASTLLEPLLLRAKVVWVKPATSTGRDEHARAGVAFDHKSAASVLALFELVNATRTRAG
jgi:hypothetical protein